MTPLWAACRRGRRGEARSGVLRPRGRGPGRAPTISLDRRRRPPEPFPAPSQRVFRRLGYARPGGAARSPRLRPHSAEYRAGGFTGAYEF